MNRHFLKKPFWNLLIMLSIISGTMFSSNLFADDSGSGLMKRENIELKYKWNLQDLYLNDEAWEKDFKEAEKAVESFKKFEGKLSTSKDILRDYLRYEEKMEAMLERLRMYASLSKDLNLKDTKYQGMYERVMALYNNISAATSWVRPELLSIPEDKLWSMVNANQDLRVFKHYFEDVLRGKAHTLPKEQEKILALSQPVEETFMTNYRLLTGADFEYPTVLDDEGNEIKMSPARFYSAMTSKDRDYRRRAYEAIYVPYFSTLNLLTSNYNGSIKAKIFNAKARNYDNSLDAALDINNIPVEVYHNLVNTVNENLGPLQRWGKLKMKALGINDLHAYDTYVTIFEAEEKRYSPDEAMELVTKSLAPLGEDYIKSLKFAFENRWVDFYETDAKRSGAYSTGAVKGVHPYVLMNWGYTLNDVFTLTHEMGHNMHSWYTANTQPFPYADYPIFLAEVASITNEMLLLDYLIKNADTKLEKMALIEQYLNNIKGTFYRQTRFAEFEWTVAKMMEEGQAMTPDKYAQVFGDMYKKYWGDAMVVDKEEANSWPRIPHFYYNYYVYQYATSFAAAQAIASMMVKEGQPAIDRYLNFLKSGKSEYAIPTLKKLGVDMTSKESVLAVIEKANELLNEMEKLMAE